MNQGDPTEGRVYFLTHFVAKRLGYFDAEGVDVQFVWADPGNYLAKSGQIPAVLKGEADFTIGGPMVTMKMQAEGTANLVNFCAVVQKNPWFLVAREPVDAFEWSMLEGKTILDIGAITTATFSLRWILKQEGVTANIIETGEGEATAMDAFIAGKGDYAFHSLHAFGPYIADGEVFVAKDLASRNGDVPWSAYIALPKTLEERKADIEAFMLAITRAQQWLASASVAEIAALVAPDYPDYPGAGLIEAIDRYKAMGLWPTDPLISRADFERFRGMLIDVGWFSTAVPYEDQVPASLARDAIATLAGR